MIVQVYPNQRPPDIRPEARLLPTSSPVSIREKGEFLHTSDNKRAFPPVAASYVVNKVKSGSYTLLVKREDSQRVVPIFYA